MSYDIQVGPQDLLKVAETLGRMVEGILAKEPVMAFYPIVAVLLTDERERDTDICFFGNTGGGDETGEWKKRMMTGIGKEVFEMRKFPLAAVLACEAWRQAPQGSQSPVSRP